MAKKQRKEVTVNNEGIGQQLFRRNLLLGNSLGEVNTSPLTRDYNAQFGYPTQITKYQYQELYDRNPIAHRVVQLLPLECWQSTPQIYDSDAPADSDFEKQVAKVFSRVNMWGYLRRVDILSGIGNFGLLLMGVGDGKKLSEPIETTDSKGRPKRYDLQYVRPFPHTQVEIAQSEADSSNPRYGHPTMYRIQFQPNDLNDIEGFVDLSMQDVHWSRVIHIADNREVSEIYGVPRLQLVYNNILDLAKVLGSSGEMFYKGAYPGFVVEATDNMLGTVSIDSESIRAEVEKYENNLQRWMALKNAHVNPLSSSYSDPSGHVEVCLNQIAIAMGCPIRILLGSERGELASSQDAVIWRKRLMERQNGYLTPFVIRPVIQYLIKYGIVETPYNKDFHVDWPDLSTDTKMEEGSLKQQHLDFIRTYLDGQLERMISKEDFLMEYLDYTEDEARKILENAKKAMEQNMEDEASNLANMMMGNAGGGMGGAGGGMGGGMDMGGMGGGLDLGGLGGGGGMGLGGLGGGGGMDLGGMGGGGEDQGMDMGGM